jgi:integrase
MPWLTEAKRLNRASGKKEPYYAIQWREGVKTRTKGLGFIPKAEAKQMLKIAEGKLAAGEPAAPPPTESGSAAPVPEAPRPITLGEYLDDRYLAVVERDRAPKTASSARSAAKALKRELGRIAVEAIDYALVDRFITVRRGEGRRTRTVAIELWLLNGCLAHAEACGLIAVKPKLPKVRGRDRKAPKFLTAEESTRLLAALRPLDAQPFVVTRGRPPINRDRLTYLAVLMALNLGMRKREILTRSWSDVRWAQGRTGALLVGRQDAARFDVKTRRDRVVPLTPEVREELERLHGEVGRPEAGWIFPASGGVNQPRQDFGIALRRACVRAGVPVVGPHALRHTWASRLAMAGVDRKALMDLGGWASGQMLDQVYAHVTPAHLEDVMARSGIGVPPAGHDGGDDPS